MLTDLLIPAGAPLELISAALTPAGVCVNLATTAAAVPCSSCQTPAQRVHSHYQRTLADRPLAQHIVRLQVQARRFFCDNPACPRRTFSESVPDVIIPYARRTVRLASEQRCLGLDVGGAVGARIAQRQGMPLSPNTVLRLVRRDPLLERTTPTHLGVDDFALLKGQIYGAILVDLDKHRPVDLLPDRSAATFKQWLLAHPGVELIARDRASEFAEAAASGAPNAVQVADRFHLMVNAREMLQRLLERQPAALRAATNADPALADQPSIVAGAATLAAPALAAPPLAAASVPASMVPAVAPTPELPLPAQRSQHRRAARLELYQKVRELHAQGRSRRVIAAQLQLGRNTVRRFVVADEYPERATRRTLSSKLDCFVPYLEQQLAAGGDNGMELWRRLRDEHGYNGSRALVSRWVAGHRQLVPPVDPATPKPRRRGHPPAPSSAIPAVTQRRCSARQAAFLLLRQPEELEAADGRVIERLCQLSAEVETAQRLTHEFMGMVRQRLGERLEEWLTRMDESGIAELQSFAAGIKRDKAAVFAGLTLPYSSGQVEGQVNRLKFVKRSMFGRSNFDLLRHRVLAA